MQGLVFVSIYHVQHGYHFFEPQPEQSMQSFLGRNKEASVRGHQRRQPVEDCHSKGCAADKWTCLENLQCDKYDVCRCREQTSYGGSEANVLSRT